MHVELYSTYKERYRELKWNSMLMCATTVIPESYQIHVEGSCHQSSSCLPRVHHQLRQEQLRVDTNWKLKI